MSDERRRDAPRYRAMPATGGAVPGVLVVLEIFGVHEHIKDVCRPLAKAGYFAIAPELSRARATPARLDRRPRRSCSTSWHKVPDAQLMADLDAAVKKRERKAEPQGIGDHRLLLGRAHDADVRRAQSAGSRPPCRGTARSAARLPTGRQDRARRGGAADQGRRCSASTAATTRGIPIDTVEKLFAALKAAGNAGRARDLPGHAARFHADYRPSYRKEQAEDGWKRTLAWFKQGCSVAAEAARRTGGRLGAGPKGDAPPRPASLRGTRPSR